MAPVLIRDVSGFAVFCADTGIMHVAGLLCCKAAICWQCNVHLQYKVYCLTMRAGSTLYAGR